MSRLKRPKHCLKLLLVIMVLKSISAKYLDGCNQPLGMQSGDILDEDITASSSFSEVDVGPQNARLGLELNSGAWCPNNKDGNYSDEYLQINLHHDRILTAVATQGRHYKGGGLEYISHYKLMYIGPNSSMWETYMNRAGEQVINGNSDMDTIVTQLLNPSIRTSAVRFVPTGEQEATVCMRVELYGCNYTDVPPSTMPELKDKLLKNELLWIIIGVVVLVFSLTVIGICSFILWKKKREKPPVNPPQKVRYVRKDWPELQGKTVQRREEVQVGEPLIENAENPAYRRPTVDTFTSFSHTISA